MTKGEKAESKRALEALAAAGWEPTMVDDGEAVNRAVTIEAALEALEGLDDARLLVAPNGKPKGGVLLLVFGNAEDGSEVIADASDLPEIVAACWPN